MKKIILSSLTILAAVAIIAGGAYAQFTDTDSFDGNTISTATVDIDARSEPQGLLPKPLVATGLIPGEYTGYARGVVYNTSGSTNVRVWMYATNISGTACNKTNLQVWTGHAASGAASERNWTLYNGNIWSFNGPANKVELTGYVFTAPIWLPSNTSAVIQQRAQLDPSAGNAYQNTTCTWDEVFVAETPL